MVRNLGLQDVSILHHGDRGDAEHDDGEDDRQADGGESGDHAVDDGCKGFSVKADLTGPGVWPQLCTRGGM